MGILEVLFNLLIFSLPLGVVLRLTIIPNVFLYPNDLISSAIFIVFIFNLVVKKRKVEQLKIILLAASFLISGVISFVFSPLKLSSTEFLISFSYLLRYAIYLSILFSAQFLSDDFKKSVNIKLITSGLIFTIFGYIQYFFYPNLKNLFYAGWDEHLYRFFSTFLDPNFAGSLLVLLLILLSRNILGSIKEGLRPFIFMFFWLVVFLGILLTYSRSAFVMLIMGFAVLFTIRKAYKTLFALMLIFTLFYFLFANTKIEGLNPFRIVSSEARIDSARAAFTIFSKNPIFGVGFNAYRYAQIEYGFRNKSSTLVSNSDAGTDNSYLFVLATLGVVGFLIYLDFLFNIIKAVYKQLKQNALYAEVTFASIISVLVNTIFINSLFYTPIMIWMFILIGVTLSKKRLSP